MKKCIEQNGMKPFVAATGFNDQMMSSGRVSSAAEWQILEDMEKIGLDALLAVGTNRSWTSIKFKMEIELALLHLRIPVVALVQNRTKYPSILKPSCPRFTFQKGGHMEKCDTVSEALRFEIENSKKSRRVGESEQIPRRRLR
jgi:hypothetical protein